MVFFNLVVALFVRGGDVHEKKASNKAQRSELKRVAGKAC